MEQFDYILIQGGNDQNDFLVVIIPDLMVNVFKGINILRCASFAAFHRKTAKVDLNIPLHVFYQLSMKMHGFLYLLTHDLTDLSPNLYPLTHPPSQILFLVTNLLYLLHFEPIYKRHAIF